MFVCLQTLLSASSLGSVSYQTSGWESNIQCRVIRPRNAGLIMIDGAGPCVIVFVSDSQVTVADLVQRFLCGDCQTDELRQ